MGALDPNCLLQGQCCLHHTILILLFSEDLFAAQDTRVQLVSDFDLSLSAMCSKAVRRRLRRL